MSTFSRHYRVFLADDSDLVRRRLRGLFSALPRIEVCGEADNAAEAVTSIRATEADAVILDLDLRESNGLEVLKALKTEPGAPLVIILTIHPFHEMGRHYLNAGADHYFEKGHALDGLLNLLEDLSRPPGGGEIQHPFGSPT